MQSARASDGEPRSNLDDWVAPPGIELPDFIICGAMKCGTTTVQHLLGRHPRIFIPDRELNFFDVDDLLQHSDYCFRGDGEWQTPDLADDPAAYWQWYSRWFAKAPRGSLLGEDSTCYLPSRNAPRRISLQRKPIKLIVCLRQPTERAYSQYWHLLRTGRALFSFEDTVRYTPHYVLERSMYVPQIENLLRYVPRPRVFFFILEEYLQNQESVARRLTDFLGVSYDELPAESLQFHSNRGRYPRHPRLQALKNRLLREAGNLRYRDRLPFAVPPHRRARTALWLTRLHKSLNPLIHGNAPAMSPDTRRFLDRFFGRECAGIDELIGASVWNRWFPAP